jgi:hypothetical protein
MLTFFVSGQPVQRPDLHSRASFNVEAKMAACERSLARENRVKDKQFHTHDEHHIRAGNFPTPMRTERYSCCVLSLYRQPIPTGFERLISASPEAMSCSIVAVLESSFSIVSG